MNSRLKKLLPALSARERFLIDLGERWLELLAIEAVLDEAAAEVGGEDVAYPCSRGRLTEARAALPDLAPVLCVELLALDQESEHLTNTRLILSRARELHS